MDKAKGGQPYQAKSTSNILLLVDDAPTLSDLGIEKMQAHRWQTIAAIPEGKFEQYIAEVKAVKDGELTTAGLLRLARILQRNGAR